jgi:arylsulfatase A-like enzyme/glycosyltransferase involved in cell wall biosynthesis
MKKPKGIILISLDTLRADHLGCYGYPRATSPHLDALAKEGIFFKYAFSPSSFTLPAHASIFTGKYPSHHSIGFAQGQGKLDTDIDITLAERLNELNYNSAAFVSSIALRKETNLNAGFTLYDDDQTSHERNRPEILRRDCTDTTKRVMDWLDGNYQKSFFLFIHYMDAHGAYVCPEPYSRLFPEDNVSGLKRTLETIVPNFRPIGGIPEYQVLDSRGDKKTTSFEKNVGYYISQYDGCIRYLDDSIGILLEKMRHLGIYDDTLMIITSDHGEAFGENDIYFFHGITVTREQIAVPLIVKPHKAWAPKNRVIDVPVSTLDIMPTLLALCDKSPVSPEMEGSSLVKIIEEKSDIVIQSRVLMSENELQYALLYPNHLMELFKKEIPPSAYYPCIPELIDALDLKKMYWDSAGDYCFSMPSDQYQRYKLVSDIINKFRIRGKKFKILEVGAGFEENLKKFLPSDDIFYLDKEYPPEYSEKEHFIPGDILTAEFKDTYDFVVAIDVYEHIIPRDRKKFLDSIIPLSEIGTIIAAPFDGEDVRKCESSANEVYRNSHGSDYIWLKEHAENGLPSLSDTLNLIQDSHVNPVVIPNGYLPRWFEMISAFLLTEGKAEFRPIMSTLYELYNQYYYPYDNRNPAYRQTLIIPKGDRIPDFSELVAGEVDPGELIKTNQFLESFIEKIKMATYQISDNRVRNAQVSELLKHTHNLEAIVDELQKHTHNLEAIVADRETQVTELRKHSTNLGTIVAESQKHTHNLEAIVVKKEALAAELQNHIKVLDADVAERETQISELRNHTRNLEAIVADRETRVSELQQHTHNLEYIVTDRESQIAELRQHARNLENIITERNQQLQEFVGFNQVLSNENQSIKQSLTYSLTTKFHKKVIERLLSENTRRRKYYNLGIAGCRLMINEGWDRFWWCYRERKQQHLSGSDQVIPIPPPEKEAPELENLPVIQTKISVIIPTKNAGPDFPSVLEKIKNQKGIAPAECIIVDSGSTDGTCRIAEEYGCRVFSIKPEEFNHGLTRNYGAEQAGGEFIVFLVQDAIPIGDYWLSAMLKFFGEDEKIAAVTCRQVPRSDADLFAGFILWYHYKSFNRTRNTIYSCETGFDDLAPLDKRISAGIEDTCCMMKKRTFDRIKFRNIQYGEDLDIGIRLLQTGNKTAFIYSTGVIHSHNRDALYFFKRSFVDTLATDSLLDVTQKPAGTPVSLRDLIEQILGLYTLIQRTPVSRNISFSGTRGIDLMKKSLLSEEIGPERQRFFSGSGPAGNAGSPHTLEALLAECAGLVQAHAVKKEDSLIAGYCAVLDSFSEYCSAYSSLEGKEAELSGSFDKLFALTAGSTLAAYYSHKTPAELSETESALKKKIGEGI